MTDRIRKLLIGVLVPIVIALGGAALIAVALPDLPNPVAIHWGPTGEADGFGPAATNLVILVVFVVAYSLLTVLVARGEGFSAVQKGMLATAPFLAVLLTAILAGSLWMQRGLSDATLAPSVLPLLLVGTVVGLAVAIGSWFVLPRISARAVEESATPSMQLGATQRAVWMRRTAPSVGVQVLVVGILAFVTTVTIAALALSAPPLLTAVYGGFVALIALVVAASIFWRIQVTNNGFVARSALGIPRFTVPLADIDKATVITVNPIRDFGGWGLRWGGLGRFGIVTRAGEAIEIRRTNGKHLIVTVDDASSAAALLNALRTRVPA
ncbi:MAG: DUF1648 domain-containing protein [Rhodoglobus sp.]